MQHLTEKRVIRYLQSAFKFYFQLKSMHVFLNSFAGPDKLRKLNVGH